MWNSEFGLGRLVRMVIPQTRFYFGWETLAAPVVAGAVGKLLGGGDGGAKDMNAASAELARTQAAVGREMLDRNKKVFWPLQDKIIADAENYGGVEDQEREAGLAGDQVSRAAADSKGALRRELGQYGVNPTDGRFADSFAKLERGATLADAASRNAARVGTRELGFSRRVAAAGMGGGLDQLGLSAISNASTTLGNLGLSQANLQRQRQGDVGFLLQPAIKEGLSSLKDLNLGSMFRSGSTPNVATPKTVLDGVAASGGGGGWTGFADGGKVEGPDPAETADNVPIMASKNEFVVNAEGARLLGREVIEAANLLGTMRRAAKEAKAAKAGRKMMGGGQVPSVNMAMVKYADGGRVMDSRGGPDLSVARKPIAGLRTSSGAPVMQRDFSGGPPAPQAADPVTAPTPGSAPLTRSVTPRSAAPVASASPAQGGMQMVPENLSMARGYRPASVTGRPVELDEMPVYIDMEPVEIRGKAADPSTWDFSGLDRMKINRIRYGGRP